MIITPDTLLNAVIVPTLRTLASYNPKMDSPAARTLILGTAAHESHLGKYLRQFGGGPGLGIGQVEPFTHTSLWQHHIQYRPELREVINRVSLWPIFDTYGEEEFHSQLIWNWSYSVAMMRLAYWIVDEPLPAAEDLEALAQYWDDHYNKNPNKGTPAEWLTNYRVLVLGEKADMPSARELRRHVGA